MEQEKMYALHAYVWNPIKQEYESKTLKYFDTKDSAVRSLKQRKCTPEMISYELEEGTWSKFGFFDAERRILFKDESGIDDYVDEYSRYYESWG